MSYIPRFGKFSLVLLLILGVGLITLYSVLNDLQRQEYDVRVSLDKDEYYKGEEATLKITNRGKREITFGMSYRFMKKTNDTWVEVPALGPNEAWTAALLILPPGRSYKQVVDLSRLEVGDYVLFKEIYFGESGEGKTFTIRFCIIE